MTERLSQMTLAGATGTDDQHRRLLQVPISSTQAVMIAIGINWEGQRQVLAARIIGPEAGRSAALRPLPWRWRN